MISIIEFWGAPWKGEPEAALLLNCAENSSRIIIFQLHVNDSSIEQQKL